MTLFSIITIARNNLDGLVHTAASAVGQDCNDYEWIVIDGASEDGSAAFLKHSPADWISEPDTGIYDAMNKGIARARGNYLLFLNAGDTLEDKNTLSLLKAEIKTHSPDFLYGNAIEGKSYKPARHHSNIALGMFTHHQAMLYRREALDGLTYNTDYKIAADYDFTWRFLKTAKNIHFVREPICVFKPGGVSQTNAAQGRREQYAIRKQHGVFVPTNIVITAAQALIWRLRQIFPNLYWQVKYMVRSSCNRDSGTVQNAAPAGHPKSPA